MPYTVERTNSDVLTIRHNDVVAGWSQRYLFVSDVHFDSPHCDRKLLTKHLDQAKACGAGIVCVGDWFDAMGGAKDKRATKETIRTEDKVNHYFDSLVDNSAEYLAPYADNLIMLSDGNHETAIIKHNETDLLERLCRALGTQHMGYSGFLRLMFQGEKGGRTTRRVHWFHGAGGGGPVTKAMIANNRRAVSVHADIYVGGHIHTTGYDENVVVKLSDSGRIYYDMQYHLTIPGYKFEYTPAGGFHVERGRSARPQGGWWVNFQYEGDMPGHIGYRMDRTN